MRKKILSMLVVVLVAFVFCACGSEPSPSDVAKDFLKAVKAQDSAAIEKLYVGESSFLEETEGAEELPEGLGELMEEKMLAFEYEIGEEAIDGDSATVDVTITTYSIGAAFDDFLTEYISQAFGLAIAGADEEKLNELAMEIFTEKFEALSEKDYSETASLALEKTEEGWIVSEIDDDADIMNALTGGTVKAMNEMLENFE